MKNEEIVLEFEGVKDAIRQFEEKGSLVSIVVKEEPKVVIERSE